MLEAGVSQHLHREFAAFIHAAIFGGDGRLLHPCLHALHSFVMALRDFGVNGRQVIVE